MFRLGPWLDSTFSRVWLAVQPSKPHAHETNISWNIIQNPILRNMGNKNTYTHTKHITCSHPARESRSIWKSRSISLSLSPASLFVSLSLSLSLSVYLSTHLPIYLLIYQSTYLLMYLPVYLLPSYLSIYLPIYSYPSNMLIRSSKHLIPVCLHQIWPIKRYRSIPIHLLLFIKSFLSTCLPSYLSTCLPCLSIYLPTYLHIHPSIHPSMDRSMYLNYLSIYII